MLTTSGGIPTTWRNKRTFNECVCSRDFAKERGQAHLPDLRMWLAHLVCEKTGAGKPVSLLCHLDPRESA